MFNLQKTRGALRNLSAAVCGLGLSAVAMAQSADPFTTAVTDATAKIGIYGAALVGVSAVGVIFMIAMKYVKRIPRAA